MIIGYSHYYFVDFNLRYLSVTENEFGSWMGLSLVSMSWLCAFSSSFDHSYGAILELVHVKHLRPLSCYAVELSQKSMVMGHCDA